MKLKSLLVEAIEHHVNREDLVVILDAFSRELTMTDEHCFLKALSEALDLLGFNVPETEMYHEIRRSNVSADEIHPRHAQAALRKRHNIKVSFKHLTTAEQVKAMLRRKLPVILSIRWSDPYYLVARMLRDGAKDNDDAFDDYRNLGATDEMVKKAVAGIISYPTDKMIKNSRPENIRHAILCVGYDAGDDAFIVRDYNSTDSNFDGFFKVEAKNFFDAKLQAHDCAIVEAAVSVMASALDAKAAA